jgi:hypothetical protein
MESKTRHDNDEQVWPGSIGSPNDEERIKALGD